jgi:hypothetical protein
MTTSRKTHQGSSQSAMMAAAAPAMMTPVFFPMTDPLPDGHDRSSHLHCRSWRVRRGSFQGGTRPLRAPIPVRPARREGNVFQQ